MTGRCPPVTQSRRFSEGIRLICKKQILTKFLSSLIDLIMKKTPMRTRELWGIRLFLFFSKNKRISSHKQTSFLCSPGISSRCFPGSGLFVLQKNNLGQVIHVHEWT
jgi:hypothetical protein